MKRPRGDSASGGGTRLAKVKQASETESMHIHLDIGSLLIPLSSCSTTALTFLNWEANPLMTTLSVTSALSLTRQLPSRFSV